MQISDLGNYNIELFSSKISGLLLSLRDYKILLNLHPTSVLIIDHNTLGVGAIGRW